MLAVTGRERITYTNSSTGLTNSALQIENPSGTQNVIANSFAGVIKSSLRGDTTGNLILNANSNNFYFNNDFGSNPTFINGTTTFLTLSGANVTFSGNLTATQIDTGQGLTEVHLMNQNLRTTDSPTFVNVTSNLSGIATSANLLTALANYVWSASSLPTSFGFGITNAFVGPAAGEGSWQNYGSVMTMRTYSGGGGSLQLYTPYGPNNGGTRLQARFGDYNVSSGNSWTAWRLILDSVSDPYAYNMNQYVRTTDAVTFATVDTGQGATEVHLMNQNIRTSDSPTFASVNAGNFRDGTGTYNVNLGSGGTEGRGLVAGYSGGSVGGIGYNVRHTTTGGSWIIPGGAESTYLLFNNGFTFYYAGIGEAGRTAVYSQLGRFDTSGNLSVTGTITGTTVNVGGGTTYYINNTTSNLNSLTLAGTLVATGAITGASFSGAGTGLTGTASSLSIGGNAATSTTVTGTNLGSTAGPLSTITTVGGWAQPSGYNQMITAAGSSGLPSTGTASPYYGYTILSRRDAGGGYSGLLIGYNNDEMWFTYNTVNTGYATWRRVWHEGNLTNLNQLTNGPGYITVSSIGNGILTLNTSGVGLSGSTTFTANQSGGATFTVASNATSANAINTIVSRDGSGNFIAGTRTAALSGTATTATNWGTYGAVPAAGTSFATANTIGRSDANGYTFFGYINSNTGNSENPTISQVIVTNGSDNFYRKSSISSFTSAVQSNASGNWGINATTATSATTVTGATQNNITSIPNLATVGTITTGTWSGTFGAVSGANLTSLTAGNLSGTIPSAVLGNSTLRVGTTAIALNRASANQGLTGITSIAMPGATSGAITLTPAATAGTTAITIPATAGTLVTTGDTGTVISAMILDGTILNGDINASAGIVDTKLATIATAGKVSNSATTATSANTANAIVARDGNGDFIARYVSGSYVNTTDDISAGTITHIVAKFGNDFHRSATAAKVASFISGQTMNIGGNSATVTHNASRTDATAYPIVWASGTNSPMYSCAAVTITSSTGLVTATLFTETSSERYKENIITLGSSLDKILSLRGVEYNRKGSDTKEIGVIAEEVASVVPEIVNYTKDGEADSVSYGRITALLIEAMKELKFELDSAKKEIEELKNKYL